MPLTNSQNIKLWSEYPQELIEQFGDEGDFSRKYLLNPTIFTLLKDVKGKKVLDAGSGQGYLSRLLSKKGAKVTGIEPVENFISYALAREKTEKMEIEYIKADLSIWDGPKNAFDIVVSNMVFMDIPDYQSAISNCIKALKPGGIFLFSILHPCYDASVDWQEQPFLTVKEYFEEYEVKQKYGYFIHRTLSSYLNLVIDNGCKLTRIVEPQLTPEQIRGFDKPLRDEHVPSFIVIMAEKQ